MDSSIAGDCTMEIVMKNIYTSCDPDNSNLVPVSKLIEFITPYMIQDLSALEVLRRSLDPENKDICVSSEKFYEAMDEWTKKITNSSDSDNDFNNTPSISEMFDKEQLPYIQSTPRASFGQKLLNCEGLLNLSNVSAYSLSTSVQAKENSTAGQEKTILEEEIKRLEHHLNKVTSEMMMVKLQLTTAEEQNEILQADLDRCKTRLHSEQQVIEHLQTDKRYNDELREELNFSKKQIEELNKKILQYERDNNYFLSVMQQNEKENAKLEEKCEELSRREQEAKKEIFNIKTELDLKDQEITTILKVNDEMRNKIKQQRDVIDQLTNENELLEHQKTTLEKTFRDSMSARRDSLVHQYKTCLADSSALPDIDQSADEESFFKMQSADFNNFAQDSLHAEISQAVQHRNNFPCSFSLLSFENHEKLMELEDRENMIEAYKEEINQLKIENDSIQEKLDAVNLENDKFKEQILEMRDRVNILEKDLENLLHEKKNKEADLEQIVKEKSHLQMEVTELKKRISELTDQNNNLVEKEKLSNTSLELKSKVLAELEHNLLELKKEFTSLQIENIAKEKELNSKFNFEAAYKKIQLELNERNKEVETLTKSKEEQQDLLTNLTTKNQELEQALKQAKKDLKENEDKSKQMLSLNENIALTASQVQVHLDRKNEMINELVDLNRRFESNIAKLQEDLHNKIAEVTELRDCLQADIEIKNIMWRDNTELKAELDVQIERNEKMSDEIKAIGEKHEEEYNELLANYNKEVEKNCKLCEQIYTYKNDLSSSISKYNEETDKNHKLYKQVSALKKDIDTIRENQDEYKTKINKKLSDYEELITRLEKKLQDAESDKEILKTTLNTIEKRKPVRFFDSDTNLSDSSKNRSFEKQKLAIDRLKEKLENVTEQYQREKIKREILEQTLQEKNDVEQKYTTTLLEFEQKQSANVLEKQELQNSVADLSHKIKVQEEHYKELENKSKEMEETLTIKLTQMEQQNQHLFTEMRNKEFVIQNSCLEIETYKKLFKNEEKKAQELSLYLRESNKKQNEVQLLNSQLIEKDNKIFTLSSKISDQDMELASISTELTEKKNLITNLEKENKLLQEMLSKSDDSKEMELLDIEQKLKNTRRLLQCGEMELNLIEKKLSDTKEEYSAVSNELIKYEEVVRNGRSELSRVSDLIFNKWENVLEQEEVYRELIMLRESEPSERGGEICALNNRIKMAVILLEFLANSAALPMESTDSGINSLLSTKSNANQYTQSDVKMIKKFTLRPSRLIVSRPVSPDSPSVDIAKPGPETPKEINFNTSKEIYINQSPDNHICHACPYSSDDSFNTAPDELSFTKDSGIDFPSFQDSFPSITDTFLEKLGLHESSAKQSLTKEETEEKFTTFAIQIALDSRDIKERMQKQKDRCIQQHEKFLSLIRDVSGRLRDHKCIGAADPISPVFVLLEDMKFLLRDLTQSTEQFGILVCENRMMKCWNLVTNYMAFLKQDAINLRTAESVQNQNDNHTGIISSFGARFRKRFQSVQKTDQTECGSSVLPSKNAVSHRDRYKCYRVVKNSIILIFFLLLVLLIFSISIHLQCRLSAKENQVCILDDFIKTIGNPPY